MSDLLAEGLAPVAHLPNLVGAHEGADRQRLTTAPDTTIKKPTHGASARLITLLSSLSHQQAPILTRFRPAPTQKWLSLCREGVRTRPCLRACRWAWSCRAPHPTTWPGPCGCRRSRRWRPFARPMAAAAAAGEAGGRGAAAGAGCAGWGEEGAACSRTTRRRLRCPCPRPDRPEGARGKCKREVSGRWV